MFLNSLPTLLFFFFFLTVRCSAQRSVKTVVKTCARIHVKHVLFGYTLIALFDSSSCALQSAWEHLCYIIQHSIVIQIKPLFFFFNTWDAQLHDFMFYEYTSICNAHAHFQMLISTKTTVTEIVSWTGHALTH